MAASGVDGPENLYFLIVIGTETTGELFRKERRLEKQEQIETLVAMMGPSTPIYRLFWEQLGDLLIMERRLLSLVPGWVWPSSCSQ